MKGLLKPKKIKPNDTIATVSLCNGWAGDADVKWKYQLGVKRLEQLGLHVIAAPNSLKGSEYLSKHPQARAEDFIWAFENKQVNAILCNVGGNDSINVISYIDAKCIKENPKIFIGFSDVMNYHLLCYRNGLSSFYGDNLLYPIAEAQGWHKYSKYWFQKVLFDSSIIGTIEPSSDWTCEPTDYTNPDYTRNYFLNQGYTLLQGSGKVTGTLFGGHTGLMYLENTSLELLAEDFQNRILFLEDIPEFFTPQQLTEFFDWMGHIGALQKLRGIILGKANEATDFCEHAQKIKEVVSHKYGLSQLPILYAVNFGHSSPICVLPYGRMAEIDCLNNRFSILESGVE